MCDVKHALVLCLAIAAARPVSAQVSTYADTARARESIAKSAAKIKLTAELDHFTGALTVQAGKAQTLDAQEFGAAVRFVPVFYRKTASVRGAYFLWVTARLSTWAFLDGSAVLLLNGAPLRLDGAAKPAREVIEGGVVESFTLSLTPEVIDRLARASRIEVRLNGQRGNVEGDVKWPGIAQFQRITDAPAVADTIH